MNVPNFVEAKFVDENGHLTDTWKQIMLQLLQQLQKNIGNEGLVAPTQDITNITTIQNNTTITNGISEYTCQFGTILYDSTNKSIRIAIDNGAGVPIFKTVTLT